MASRETFYVQVIGIVSFALSALVSVALTITCDVRWLILAVFLAAFCVAISRAARWIRDGTRLAETLLWISVLNVLLLLPELTLRAVDFSFVSGIQFGYPRPEHFVRFEPDAARFWKLQPSRSGINSWGFHGDEVVPPAAGTCRIVFLGDSCMEHGYAKHQDYPSETVQFLKNASFRKQPIDFVSLAVPGYTSYQGRKTVERYGGSLDATIAIVAYGWNDQWLAYGAADADRRVSVVRTKVYNNVRSLQLLRRVVSSFRKPQVASNQVRVPTEQYRQNLTAIAEALMSKGVIVVLLTPPTSHYALGVPQHLVDLGLAKNKESVTAMHSANNQVVREVAAHTGALLFDLEANLVELRGDEVDIFSADGIHFTQPGGRRWIASQLAMFLFGCCNLQ